MTTGMKYGQMFVSMILAIMAVMLLSELYASDNPIYFGDRKQLLLLGGALLLVCVPTLFVLTMTKSNGLSWRSFVEVPIVTACWMALLHFTGMLMGANAFWGSTIFGGNQIIEEPGWLALIAIGTVLAFVLNSILLSREDMLLRDKQATPIEPEPEPLKPTEETKKVPESSDPPKASETKDSSLKATEPAPLPKEEKAPPPKAEPVITVERTPVKLATTEEEKPFVWTTR